MSRRSARKVNIEIVELTSDTIKFFVKGIDVRVLMRCRRSRFSFSILQLCFYFFVTAQVSMANSIRRVCIGEVPTLAIENVTIERNDTVLQDEFICHRLGFIPLKSTDDVRLKRMNYRNNSCTCGMTCPRCEVRADPMAQASRHEASLTFRFDPTLLYLRGRFVPPGRVSHRVRTQHQAQGRNVLVDEQSPTTQQPQHSAHPLLQLQGRGVRHGGGAHDAARGRGYSNWDPNSEGKYLSVCFAAHVRT